VTELQSRLARLKKEDLVAVALRKLDGYTNDEIAAQLGCACRTVERRLRLVRSRIPSQNTAIPHDCRALFTTSL